MGKLKTKLFLGVGSMSLLMSMLLPIAPVLSPHAKAGNLIFNWENHYAIRVGDVYWGADTPYTQPRTELIKFTNPDDKDGCPDYYVPPYQMATDGGNISTGMYVVSKPSNNPAVSGCQDNPIPGVSAGNTSRQQLMYAWVDKNTIVRLGDDTISGETFTRDGTTDKFISSGGGECSDMLAVNSNNTTAIYNAFEPSNTPIGTTADPTERIVGYVESTNNTIGDDSVKIVEINGMGKDSTGVDSNPCRVSFHDKHHPPNDVTVTISFKVNAEKKAGDGVVVPGAGGLTEGGDVDKNVDSCGAKLGLGWLICQIIGAVGNFIDAMVNKAENVIILLLTIDKKDYGDNGGVNKLKTSWSAIRIISTVAMVGIALFVIISQMVGFEFFSAYTVKKMVPRLVIAIILIQLSWVLMVFAIEIVNILGIGLQTLMFAPFGGNDAMKLGEILKGANIGGGSAGTVMVLGVGIGALAASAGGGWLFVILAAVVAVSIAIVVAMVTLLFRKILIIALMVLAPLAILAWILPNTDKYFKMWWSNFSKLLLMFPLIMGLIAAGTIFASIVAASSVPAPLKFIFILVAYFGPFFLIPKTFSMSGSMMSSAAGAIGKVGTKAKGGIMESKPVKNRVESHAYNSKLKGMQRAEKYKDEKGILAWGGRQTGRLKAGSLGYYGEHGSVKRAQESEGVLKEAQQRAQIEYEQATKGQFFPDRMDDAEKIARAKVGDTVMLGNNKRVKATEAMQNHAFGELVAGKKDDHVRRVVEHYGSMSQRANDLKGMNAGKLIELTPDVMKGTSESFQSLSAGGAAKMGEGGWRNMSARTAELSLSPQHVIAGTAEHTEYEAIKRVATAAQSNPDFGYDMTDEKYKAATQITGKNEQGATVGPGGGAFSTATGGKDGLGREATDPAYSAARHTF